MHIQGVYASRSSFPCCPCVKKYCYFYTGQHQQQLKRLLLRALVLDLDLAKSVFAWIGDASIMLQLVRASNEGKQASIILCSQLTSLRQNILDSKQSVRTSTQVSPTCVFDQFLVPLLLALSPLHCTYNALYSISCRTTFLRSVFC